MKAAHNSAATPSSKIAKVLLTPLFQFLCHMAKLIFGCGYLGLRVARRWRASGDAVYAVTRSSERADQLLREGIQPIVADLTEQTQLLLPQDVRSVLFAIGY